MLNFLLKKKNCEKIAFEFIKKIGLEKYKNQYPNRLSGGMQRRIALARAFAPNPSILLLDEPFISIDKKIANLLIEADLVKFAKSNPENRINADFMSKSYSIVEDCHQMKREVDHV